MHGHRYGRLWRHHNSTRHSHPFAPSSSLFMGCLLGLSRCPVVCVLAGAVSALSSAEHCLRVSPDTTCPCAPCSDVVSGIQRSLWHCLPQCMPLLSLVFICAGAQKPLCSLLRVDRAESPGFDEQARIAEASQAAGACDSQHNYSSLARLLLMPSNMFRSPPSTMLAGLPSTMFLGGLPSTMLLGLLGGCQ